METNGSTSVAAVRCWIEGRRVWLEKVELRVKGLALRWEELDEDIRVDNAVQGRFPRIKEFAAAH